MIRYTKLINSKGIYFTREYIKIKKHKNKIREIKESTVRKEFLNENAEILVVIEELEKEILIDYFSPSEIIKEYLGESFIP